MFSAEIDSSSSRSLYVQIYEYLKKELAEGRIVQGERLPSIRNMAKMLGVSVTTVRMAYDQLLVEGYLESRPQSGYYALQSSWSGGARGESPGEGRYAHPVTMTQAEEHQNDMFYDPESFDFVKWKKCMASVLNYTPELLLSEGDRQGEPALRTEIASYLYKSRGVVCDPGQVVISAGTQQLVTHIARILKAIGITLVCTEEPGYAPARMIFGDRGFGMSSIPVRSDGIEIIGEAVEAAKDNAKLNGLDNCDFIAGDVLKVLDDISEKPDYIILDPPRDGIHPKALDKIIDYGVDSLVYISCKPTSLARDLEVFLAHGYHVTRLACVDMFPGTYHVETVCLLSKLSSPDSKQPQCPDEKVKAIEDAMRHFQMIK